MSLKKQCAKCGKVIPYGSAYCESCQPAALIDKAMRNRWYDKKKRDKKSTIFYNSKNWKLLSRTRLQQDRYTCQVCGSIATEVHHKVPIKHNWDMRLDINNLISVCTSCHNQLDR